MMWTTVWRYKTWNLFGWLNQIKSKWNDRWSNSKLLMLLLHLLSIAVPNPTLFKHKLQTMPSDYNVKYFTDKYLDQTSLNIQYLTRKSRPCYSWSMAWYPDSVIRDTSDTANHIDFYFADSYWNAWQSYIIIS